VETTQFLFGACGLLIGLSLGWLLEWRIDAAHWKQQVIHLKRRETLLQTESDNEIASAHNEAERQISEQLKCHEAEIAEIRAQALEQVAAAYARVEIMLRHTQRES
jgi:hypothetical protein